VLDVLKNWALLKKLFAPPSVPSWLRACLGPRVLEMLQAPRYPNPALVNAATFLLRQLLQLLNLAMMNEFSQIKHIIKNNIHLKENVFNNVFFTLLTGIHFLSMCLIIGTKTLSWRFHCELFYNNSFLCSDVHHNHQKWQTVFFHRNGKRSRLRRLKNGALQGSFHPFY